MAELGPVTCAGCGLLCDDVTLDITAGEGHAVRLTPFCRVGSEWFSERIGRRDGPPATIDGEAVDVDTALSHAAELLRGARRPWIDGFDGATVEDGRAAVALADRLGAIVTTAPPAARWPGAPAVPLRGASTATLGEIRDRSGVVVIWREDPETTHPRLIDRLRLGVTDRTLVVVDDRDTATAQRADLRLSWPRERDVEALTSLHVLQKGLQVPSNDRTVLLERLRSVPHAAFVYGPALTDGAGGQRKALALHELVRALCHERHVVTLELPRAPGTRSADDVLTWQSGYGGSVDFASGHPELVTATDPVDGVDVTLLVEPGPARDAEIALGSLAVGPGVGVWIRTAPAGVSATGTAHRLDGIPLALQAPLPNDAPTAASLLTRLLAEIDA